jgi:transcriptional regulator with XRE-family HTH domain
MTNKKSSEFSEKDVGSRIRVLRERCDLSVRKLGELSGVTAGMISTVERNKTSPSLATLHKILVALGSDLASFFGENEHVGDGPIFPREHMRLITDEERSYSIIFPLSDDIKIEMMDEQLTLTSKKSDFETLKCDVAGCVISGTLNLEIEGEPPKLLRAGDGFYVKKGISHRGFAVDNPVRLIAVYTPPRY